LFLVILILSINIFTNSIIRKKSTFALQDEYKNVIFGHSHSECAYNDSLISNTINLSYSGESYFYTYLKLKNVLKDNPEIETCIIEFTNNQIRSDWDERIWKEDYLKHRFPKLSPFMSLNQHLILFSKNSIGYTESVSLSIRKSFSTIARNKYNYSKEIGGYLQLKGTKIDSILEYTDKEPEQFGISKYNLVYLDSIIQYCNQTKRKLILIRSPQHQKNPDLSNEIDFQKTYNERYSEVKFIDLNNYLVNDNDFYDLGHLNKKGSSKISKWLNDHLNSKN